MEAGLHAHRSGTRGLADAAWTHTRLFGTSAHRGWDGFLAAAGQSRAWDATTVCFAGHWIALNTGRRPHVVERETPRGTITITTAPGRYCIVPADYTLTARAIGVHHWGGVQLSRDKVLRVLGRPIPVHEQYGACDPKLVAMLKLVVGEVVHGDTPEPLWGEGMCIGIIARLATIFGAREAQARVGGLDARRMRVVVERMADDVGARHTIVDLAQLAELSPAHFARAFKQETGVTPHTYLMRLRLERARASLATAASLRDVAAECGFADQAHLSRLFKRRFGLTPGELRRRVGPA